MKITGLKRPNSVLLLIKEVVQYVRFGRMVERWTRLNIHKLKNFPIIDINCGNYIEENSISLIIAKGCLINE